MCMVVCVSVESLGVGDLVVWVLVLSQVDINVLRMVCVCFCVSKMCTIID